MLTEQAYKLDSFLSSVEERSIFDLFGMKVKNEYEKLPKIIKQCRTRLEEAIKQPRFDELSIPKTDEQLFDLINNYWDAQSYEYEISLPIGDDFYKITWSIPKAHQIIRTYNIKHFRMFVSFAAQGTSLDSVQSEYIDQARNNDEPIIVIHYPLLNTQTRTIVIDGNHRLAAKIIDKEQYIKGYFLDSKQQYKALAGELDRTLYTVHNNLGMIIEYMTGRISKSQLKQWLLPL